MNFLKKFYNDLVVSSPVEKEIVNNEILFRNVQYIYYMSLFAVPISLAHIILFYMQIDRSDGVEYFWRTGIIASHGISVVFFSLILILLLVLKRKSPGKKVLYFFMTYSTFLFVMVFAVSIVVIDQMVTPAITPFIILCIVASLLLLIKPYLSIMFFSFVYAGFYLLLPLTQNNELILLSNRVNGITAVGIGIILSIIMWKTTVGKYEQERVIKAQKDELEKNYKALIDTSTELKTANETKNRLFSIIAHDLRGPLGSVHRYLNHIYEEKPDREELLESLNVVSKTHENIHSMLENLLTWSAMQTGAISYMPDRYNYYSIVYDNCNLLSQSASMKNIVIENKVNSAVYVICDREMINIVFRNLIGNAIKYTAGNGVITVSAEVINDEIVTSVADNGIGIMDDIVEVFNNSGSVFERRIGTSGEKGSGLGLVLCREFLEKHGGRLYAEKGFPSGSIFKFTLPAAG